MPGQKFLLTVVALLVPSTSAFLPTPQSVSRPITTATTFGSGSRIVVFSSSNVDTEPGFIKTISKPGSNKAVKLGDIATVKYTCYLPDNEKVAPFAKAEKQKMVSAADIFIAAYLNL